MKKYKLPRRELLKTVAGSVLLAPLLRMRKLEAQNLQPKRLIIFNAAGSFVPEYFPTGSGANFQLQEPLAPLRGLESEMIFMRELHHTVRRGNHHEIGMVTAYSAATEGSGSSDLGLQPTIDQIIAQDLADKNTTPIKFLAQGLYTQFNNPKRSYMTYTGPNQPIIPERDFTRTYNRIFAGINPGDHVDTGAGNGGNPNANRIRIFDVATEELNEIKRYLGSEERSKLDFHITSLQDLSRELSSNTDPLPSTNICPNVNLENGPFNLRNEDAMERGLNNLVNLTSAALQCDRTRVATIQVGFSGNHYNGLRGFRNGGGGKDPDSWHDWIHHVASNQSHRYYGEWVWMTQLWARHLANLAESLRSVPEGNGTMLDNTVILWGCEMGIGHSHSPNDVPYLTIGGRNMGFNCGNYLRFNNSEPHAKLLTSIQHAFDLPVRGTGNQPDCGPLNGVLV